MARIYKLSATAPKLHINYKEELNEQQYAAVSADRGASLVIAGAGSGKTRTLTYRVAWLLEHGAVPDSILLLTFTNKASREMLHRVNDLLPSASVGIWGGTFHSIGSRILRQHAELLGFRSGFSILDQNDQQDLLESVIVQEGFRNTEKRFPKSSVLSEIFSLTINTGQPINELIPQRYRYFTHLMEAFESIHVAYEARKIQSNAFDFDDLISKVFDLFQTHSEIRDLYRQQFKHILVDEYQDVNRLQAELVDLLGRDNADLMVVGDDAQAIYSWRGADCANILEFPKRYPGARVFKIETNYRSVPEVLELANASISYNPHQFKKHLRSSRKNTERRPALIGLSTKNQQATFIAQRILDLRDEGIPLYEIAILYRAHFHSMELQFELTRRGIPFTITSGLRFFEQAHIKDVAAFMKLAVNPDDEVAFKRIVKLLAGIGNRSAEKMWETTRKFLDGTRDFSRLQGKIAVPKKAASSWEQLVHILAELVVEVEDSENKKSTLKPARPFDMINSVLLGFYEDYMKDKFANFDSRKEDLQTFINYSEAFENAEEFLTQLALLGAVETADTLADDNEQVCLSTVHQAKGLEWHSVFVIGLSQGMFPSAKAIENDKNGKALEEERRLFYVAVTRCKDELYLLYPQMNTGANYGDRFLRPSPFLTELPENLSEMWEIEVGFAQNDEDGDDEDFYNQENEDTEPF
ncbi:MAG: ATP-dependent helicase [Chthoniobacterales bacterium]